MVPHRLGMVIDHLSFLVFLVDETDRSSYYHKSEALVLRIFGRRDACYQDEERDTRFEEKEKEIYK